MSETPEQTLERRAIASEGERAWVWASDGVRERARRRVGAIARSDDSAGMVLVPRAELEELRRRANGDDEPTCEGCDCGNRD